MGKKLGERIGLLRWMGIYGNPCPSCRRSDMYKTLTHHTLCRYVNKPPQTAIVGRTSPDVACRKREIMT